jgi:hypothetical protein
MKRKVPNEKFAKWTNGHLAKSWGGKAAARTWHITTSGRDVTFADPFDSFMFLHLFSADIVESPK